MDKGTKDKLAKVIIANGKMVKPGDTIRFKLSHNSPIMTGKVINTRKNNLIYLDNTATISADMIVW